MVVTTRSSRSATLESFKVHPTHQSIQKSEYGGKENYELAKLTGSESKKAEMLNDMTNVSDKSNTEENNNNTPQDEPFQQVEFKENALKLLGRIRRSLKKDSLELEQKQTQLEEKILERLGGALRGSQVDANPLSSKPSIGSSGTDLESSRNLSVIKPPPSSDISPIAEKLDNRIYDNQNDAKRLAESIKKALNSRSISRQSSSSQLDMSKQSSLVDTPTGSKVTDKNSQSIDLIDPKAILVSIPKPLNENSKGEDAPIPTSVDAGHLKHDAQNQTREIRDQNEEIILKRIKEKHFRDQAQYSPALTQSSSSKVKNFSNQSFEKPVLEQPIQSQKFIPVTVWPDKKKLPESLQILETLFQALEHTLVFALAANKQYCTFSYVKKSVENVSSRAFSVEKLSQIRFLFPNAYEIVYPDQSNGLGSQISGRSHNGASPLRLSLKSDNFFISLKFTNESGSFFPRLMETRRNFFRKQLLINYNQSKDPFFNNCKSISNSDNVKEQIPRFPVSDLAVRKSIPLENAIYESKEEAPVTRDKGSQLSSISDSTANQSSHSSKPQPLQNTKISASEEKEKPVSKAKDLLARIRAKQQESQKKYTSTNSTAVEPSIQNISSQNSNNTTPPSEKEKSRMIMIIDCLNFIFGIERKTVLPLGTVTSKIIDSLSVDLSQPEIHALLAKISNLVPEWLSFESISEKTTTKPNEINPFSSPKTIHTTKGIISRDSGLLSPFEIVQASKLHAISLANAVVKINRSSGVQSIKKKILGNGNHY
ncbi:hypothetical protein BB560_000658 [Smittium megazygosporum]|uniref:CDT1 Geminin-binding domain-containing protein n=1 Tax=Smittium megazygosporum TaxID=133381 RepID=A0A2T9ZJV3_9FUNG|nr:hypothetical protein BB560_000658 [Smittium megazygosporum]